MREDQFRIGAKDAPLLAKQLGGNVPQPRDLLNLANFEMFAKLMVDGVQSTAFSASTTNCHQGSTVELRA